MDDTLDMRIEQLDVARIAKASRVAFSGLPSDLAGGLETQLAQAGCAVFSNAAAHRMDAYVPLLIPECNAGHLDMVKKQSTFKDGGFIVANANCSTTGVAVPLKAVDDAFGLEFACVSTYQAISGAGYPGVPSLDIMSNVVPYIRSEEEKMETEIAKILGSVRRGKFIDHPVEFLASCVRVPVIDGHLESVTLRTSEDAEAKDLVKVMDEFRAEPQKLKLATAPLRPIIVRSEADRPQPALDVNAGEPERAKGMSTVVGRVRKKGTYFKMFVLSHNTLRGGAGGSVLNAELANAKKLL
jgi:aspartate-semialdehyde dehydrogenase